MADEEGQHQEGAARSSRKERVILKFLLGVASLLIVVVAGLGWLLLNRPAAQDALRTGLKDLQSSVDYPLYYPATVPEGFVIKPATARKDSATITFTLTYDKDKTAVIIQQARPPLMEEVAKSRQFTTPLGKAYIANLNGKRVGFLVTSKTLAMLTSQFEMAAEDIEALLRALGPV